MGLTILVTGGAGFIGSNFIHYILRRHPGYRVINLDKLTYAGNLDNLAGVANHPNYRFVHGDICDDALVEALLFERVDAVVNFAAETHVDRSITGPEAFVRTNVLGAQVLLERARACSVSRFVQISTDEVYGTLGPTGQFTEDTPLAPNSPYSASKAAADLMVRAYHRTYGLPVIITRCSNNYGPYQYPEKLIPFFITRALRDEPLPLYGDGLNVRDWLYVEDHCAAVDAVLHRGVPGEVYNIGGVREMTNLQITRLILRELGKPESLIHYVTDRPGHDRRYAIDCSKIHRDLGWISAHDFGRGLSLTVRWYLEHRPWWETLLDRTPPAR